MDTIGGGERTQRTSQVLRRVPERGKEIEVTHHVRVVARLVPVARPYPRRQSAATRSTVDRVAREISARWPKGWSAVRTVREGRREL